MVWGCCCSLFAFSLESQTIYVSLSLRKESWHAGRVVKREENHMKSNDSSKILEILYGISHKAEEQLINIFGFWSIEEKQRYFINAISLYDKLYLEYMQLTNSEQEIPYYYRIIDYG